MGEKSFSVLLKEAIVVFTSDKTDDEKYDEYDEIDSKFYELDRNSYKKLYGKCVEYMRSKLRK